MLIAALVDELRIFRWLYVSSHSEKGSGGSPPEPLPRPGIGPSRRRRSRLTDEQRRLLDPRLRAVREDDTA